MGLQLVVSNGTFLTTEYIFRYSGIIEIGVILNVTHSMSRWFYLQVTAILRC